MLPNIGPNRGRALINKFKTFDDLRHTHARDLAEVAGFEKKLASKTREALHDDELLTRIERTIERSEKLCHEKKIDLITYQDEQYPESLKSIYDPPLYLFTRGKWKKEDERSLAIVGTRAATQYGKRAVEKFA